jgi:spectinomycin phosphotransferase
VRERPDLTDAAVVESVRAGWGLAGAAVEFLPIGYDPLAWAYEARVGTDRYFLKVRRGETRPAAVLVPRFLRARGLTQVLSSVDTVAGGAWHSTGPYQFVLYPFVDGVVAAEHGLTDEQWIEYGGFLGNLHRTDPPPDVTALVPTDTFGCSDPDPVARRVQSGPFRNRWQRELAESWREHETEIAGLADLVRRLGADLRTRDRPSVLCHTDIHGGNILVTGGGRLVVVDWDTPVLAPPERDLMFVIGTSLGDRPITERQQDLFRSGYGDVEVDERTMAYYRHARVLEDIVVFAGSLLFRDDLGEVSNRDDLYWFRRQFTALAALGRAPY